MKQSITLLVAIVLGIVLPQLSVLSVFVSYLLGIMLFFSFLNAPITLAIFKQYRIYLIFLANIVIAWGAYFILFPFVGAEMAFVAFFIGLTPTALAAPAVMKVLHGNIAFVLGCVIVTNFGIALLLPFFASLISPVVVNILPMVFKILLLLGIPFVLARLVRRFLPTWKDKMMKHSGIVFYLWGSIIVIAMATASDFLRSNWEQYSEDILLIASFAAVLCVINFTVGYFLGGKKFAPEASQSLGQKNPMLMIWVALEFFTPVVALGPTSYIIFHNLVNAWKLNQASKKNKKTLEK